MRSAFEYGPRRGQRAAGLSKAGQKPGLRDQFIPSTCRLVISAPSLPGQRDGCGLRSGKVPLVHGREAVLIDPQQHLERLARLYVERPVTLFRIIYALRDTKINTFAEAFKLRR